MDSREFLERLKNPTRFWIQEQIGEFLANIQYYEWDRFYNVSTTHRKGTHDIKVELLNSPEYFSAIDRCLIDYFPASDDYKVVSSSRPYQDDYYTAYKPLRGLQFKSNVIYTRMYAIVEARCYAD